MVESHKIRRNVRGAPYEIGQRVQVTYAADDTISRRYLGHVGVIVYFDYECGCGQSYPADPMIGVRFPSGKIDEFWKEELTLSPEGVVIKRSRRQFRTPSTKNRQTI